MELASSWGYRVVYVVLFFFFQAEDGIRDLTVTGVQTCALPISVGSEVLEHVTKPHVVHRERPAVDLENERVFLGGCEPGRLHDPALNPGSRSEERRVGEECRSRWSADYLKKKKKKQQCYYTIYI